VFETTLHRARSEESFRRLRISTTTGEGRFSINGVEFAPARHDTTMTGVRFVCACFAWVLDFAFYLFVTRVQSLSTQQNITTVQINADREIEEV
jgi:hypothetical protein